MTIATQTKMKFDRVSKQYVEVPMTDRDRGIELENNGYKISVYARNGNVYQYGINRFSGDYIEQTVDGVISHGSIRLRSGKRLVEMTADMGAKLEEITGSNPYSSSEPKYMFA